LSYLSLSKNIKIKINRNIVFWFFCGCEKWSLILRDENECRQSENRLLRNTFMTNNEDVTEGQKKLRNEELHHFHSSVYGYSMGMIKSRRKHVGRPWKKGK
jgi:hypothetical protein